MNDRSLEIEIVNQNVVNNVRNMSFENITLSTEEAISEDDEGTNSTRNNSAYFANNNSTYFASNNSTYLTSNNSTLNDLSNEVNEINMMQTTTYDSAEEKNNKDIDAMKHISTRNKSYQFRALTRKTLSYQKRQKCVNIFWIIICPLLMVAVANLVGTVLRIIIPTPPEYLLCSSLNASRLDGSKYQVKETNPNIPRTLSDQIPNALPKQIVINYNLDYVNKVMQDCVFWLGRDYPYRAPYENDPQVFSDALRKRDTTFSPEPRFGYFGPSAPPLNYRYLLSKETFPWAYVRDAPNVSSGDRPLDTTNITNPSQFSPINNFNYGT
ncbi:17954_t:CDS:2, partial [Racocetra persica]